MYQLADHLLDEDFTLRAILFRKIDGGAFASTCIS